MRNIIVLDCDLISTFARVDKISLLENLFPSHQMVITTCVHNEMTELIREIEDKDNTFIIGINDILEEYNDELTD